MQNSVSDYQILAEKFPFLSLFEFDGEEFLGIIQHINKNVASVYVLNFIKNPVEQRKFIQAGKMWWDHSNRKIPINLFLKEDFLEFESLLRSYSRKDFKLIQGHEINLQDLNQKRVKRKRIELLIDDVESP